MGSFSAGSLEVSRHESTILPGLIRLHCLLCLGEEPQEPAFSIAIWSILKVSMHFVIEIYAVVSAHFHQHLLKGLPQDD